MGFGGLLQALYPGVVALFSPLYIGVAALFLAASASEQGASPPASGRRGGAGQRPVRLRRQLDPVHGGLLALPGISLFRNPERVLVITVFALALLSGFGVQRIIDGRDLAARPGAG